MSKKILVTGGAGFIGSHTIVELMDAGYAPVVLDNFSNSDKLVLSRMERLTGKPISNYTVDCRDKNKLTEIFEKEKPVGVIHFAAFKAVGESVENPGKYYDNNLNSLLVLLEVMKEQKVFDLVFSSSCTVYGEPDSIPVNEDSPLKNPASPYGFTKMAGERILQDFYTAYPDFRISILRYFNPIGAHPSGLIGELPIGVPNNLVPFITQTAAGWREKLTINGNDYATADGTCVRDYIHVTDLSKAHVAALRWLEKQNAAFSPVVFNLSTGIGYTILEVIQAFEKGCGIKIPYQFGPRRVGDIEKIYASTEKANRMLNWKTEFTLEQSMQHAWKWQQTLKEKVN